MAEYISFEETAKDMYLASVKGLLECEVPSHEFDLYISLIHSYHAYCLRIKSKDNLETKPRSD